MSDPQKSVRTYIYRSEKKADHYLYLPQQLDDLKQELPDGLLILMGELQLALELTITKTTNLVASNAEHVMTELSEKGYFLQVPPTGYVHPCDQAELMDVTNNTDLSN